MIKPTSSAKPYTKRSWYITHYIVLKINNYTKNKNDRSAERSPLSVVEKLRLKNASLKSQIQKVDLQLRQKEEMGDVLHYIDFHQLGIENKQYMAKIEERNQELLKLKMTTDKTPVL